MSSASSASKLARRIVSKYVQCGPTPFASVGRSKFVRQVMPRIETLYVLWSEDGINHQGKWGKGEKGKGDGIFFSPFLFHPLIPFPSHPSLFIPPQAVPAHLASTKR